jgi:flotillin
MEAQAKGLEEILVRQANGMKELVAAAGGQPEAAVKLMIADKLQDLIQIQVEAVKNLKIDKVTVWDGMNNKEGTPATANFLSGMLKSIPPMNDLFRQVGMELPEFLGKEISEEGASRNEEK